MQVHILCVEGIIVGVFKDVTIAEQERDKIRQSDSLIRVIVISFEVE